MNEIHRSVKSITLSSEPIMDKENEDKRLGTRMNVECVFENGKVDHKMIKTKYRKDK